MFIKPFAPLHPMRGITNPRDKDKLVAIVEEVLRQTEEKRQESLKALPTDVTPFLPDMVAAIPYVEALFGRKMFQHTYAERRKLYDLQPKVETLDEMHMLIYNSPLISFIYTSPEAKRAAIIELLRDEALSKSVGHDFYHLLFPSFSPISSLQPRNQSLRYDSSGKEVIGAYSQETLRKALKAWPDNARKALHLVDFPYRQIFNLLGSPTSALPLDQIVGNIRGALHNRFFGLVHEEKVRMHAPQSSLIIPGEISGLIEGFLYNLTKNAFKRALELDESQKDFQGHIIFVYAGKEGNKTQIAVGQTFEGIDFYNYALLGFQLAKDGKMPSSVSQATVRRYQEWISSAQGTKMGTGFGKLKVADVTNLVFLAHVSGAELKTYTSGIGLYSLRELARRIEAKVEYFFKPQSQDPKAGTAGFVLTY